MSKAVELTDYLAGVEAQNAQQLQLLDATNPQSEGLIAHFADQAAKKTVAFARLRVIVQNELEAAKAPASA